MFGLQDGEQQHDRSWLEICHWLFLKGNKNDEQLSSDSEVQRQRQALGQRRHWELLTPTLQVETVLKGYMGNIHTHGMSLTSFSEVSGLNSQKQQRHRNFRDEMFG